MLDTVHNTLSYSLNNASTVTNHLAGGQAVSDGFTVAVSDGITSAAQPVSFAITGTNDAPVAAADSGSTAFNTPFVVSAATLLANDTDPEGDALTLTAVGGATNGVVGLNAGQVTFTPNSGFSGAASFTYTVDDGHGGTATGHVNVNVAGGGGEPLKNYVLLTEHHDEVSYAFRTIGGVKVSALGGDDTVVGSKFADSINGGSGNDNLSGLGGNDVITGGSGTDRMSGGTGNDVFAFAGGDLMNTKQTADFITDFHGAGTSGVGEQDFLNLSGFSAGSTITFDSYLTSNPALQYYHVVDSGNPSHSGYILIQMIGTTNQLTNQDYHFY